MRILSLETSCDETGAAVVENSQNGKIRVISNITATSSKLHATTGGIIPEQAAREQVKLIIPVISQALLEAKISMVDIDGIAVTYGPGLIGSLLVGVETAKTLAYALDKPIIPVNHLLAHLFANFITVNNQQSTINFPFIGLIVSGGHTDLLLFQTLTNFTWLGGTRDDAAGEALDKIGRLLNLSYPAGPEIERRANLVKNPTIKFKSPLLHSDDFDFSFSGLKTEEMRFVLNFARGDTGGRAPDSAEFVHSEARLERALAGGKPVAGPRALNEELINQICYATQKAIFDVLVAKTLRAAKKYNAQTILLGGGVSANQTLKEQFKSSIVNNKLSMKVFSPEKIFCTDNAAMIGAYALMNYKPLDWRKIKANPELYFD